MKLGTGAFKTFFWGILLCYAVIMVVVVIIAFKRPYGGTGIDASQLVFIRHRAEEEKLQALHEQKKDFIK